VSGRPAAPIEHTALTEALPVDAPLGRLPAEVLGRDELVAEMTRALPRRRGRTPGVWVLAGLGGMGKSTVALQVAARAGRNGRKVWWVNAGDAVSLRGGLLEILRQAGAPDDVVREVRDGRPTAPARFWRFLSGRRTTALLVFDNADKPALLSADGHGSPGDGDGWLRPDAPVFTLVTTRTADPARCRRRVGTAGRETSATSARNRRTSSAVKRSRAGECRASGRRRPR
jgi:hypothetical protein